jgi:DNA-binding MarR family transcriptional regulator
MRKTNLTKKEQLGLFYLVRYPDYNDRELSETTGLKLSTITAIRRRLKRRGYYYTTVVPRLQMLGYEMLAVGYGRLKDPGDHLDTKALTSRFQLLNKAFFMVSDPNAEITLNMAENYTDIRRDIEEFQQFFAYHDMLEENRWNTILFPFRLSSLSNCFDYSGIVQRTYDLNVKVPQTELEEEKTGKVRLSSKERKVLLGLTTNPDVPDSTIAEKAGVSRQAVSAMKKRFVKERLIESRRILNLSVLGYQIVSFVHQRLCVGIPEKERVKLLRKIANEMPTFFFVAGTSEFAMMTAHRDFQDYTECMTAYSTTLKSSGYNFENFTRLILSVPGISEVRKHDYASVVGYMLSKMDDKQG